MEGQVGHWRARRVGGHWPKDAAFRARPPGLCPLGHLQFPHLFTLVPLDGRAGGQRLYRRSLPPAFFFCLFPTVSVWTSASISIFNIFSLRLYFCPAPPLGWPNRELAFSHLHVIAIVWNTITLSNRSVSSLIEGTIKPYHTTSASLPSILPHAKQRSISLTRTLIKVC